PTQTQIREITPLNPISLKPFIKLVSILILLKMTMVRLSSGSSSRSRATSSRSTASHWPTPLFNTSASPDRSASPGEHSPRDVDSNEPMGSVRAEDQWHADFQQSVNETQTQASRNVDHLLPVAFNAHG
ncbi:hypothetical protein MKW98_031929, partial [Papaver atlanticum]